MWAPNGRLLAFLTYVPGGEVTWTIWDRDTGAVHTVYISGSSVALGANFGSRDITPPDGRIAGEWLDNEHLLTVLSPVQKGEDPFDGQVEQELEEPTRHMRALWGPTENGGRSVTVWDSRIESICGVSNRLVLINARTTKVTTLFSGAVRAVSVSPEKSRAAIVVAIPGPSDEPQTQGKNGGGSTISNNYNFDSPVQTELHVMDLRNQGHLGVVKGIGKLGFISANWFPRWSDDAVQFALPVRQADGTVHVVRVNLPTLRVEDFQATSSLDAEVMSEVLVLSGSRSAGDPFLKTGTVFRSIRGVHGDIRGEVGRLSGSRIAVVLNDQLTVLDSRGQTIARVEDVMRQSNIAWPGSAPSTFIASKAGDFLWNLTAEGGATRERLPSPPAANARLSAVLPTQGVAIYVTESDEETDVWLAGKQQGSMWRALRFNEHLKTLLKPRQILIGYETATGQQTNALLLVPNGFKKDKPVAMIVDGYPGRVITSSPNALGALTHTYFADFVRQLLVAEGYLVLIPTVPWPSEPTTEPMDIVITPVLEAIDAAVGQGYADPDRLGFFGHSYGGYMGLAVATRTHRFKAIVVAAPYSDLVSYRDDVMSGGWSTSECGPTPGARASDELEGSGGLFRMKGAPWQPQALQRYIRNSPYFHLASVDTPILIIQGDQDAVPDSNGKRVFMALKQRGVAVQFAHYWGEMHNLRSPGNIRDAWGRTANWFDVYLQ